jgi:dipeptidase E
MKTLILTSSGKLIAANELDEFLPKPLSTSKILYVTTASKKVTSTDYIERQKQSMDKLNFSYTEYDITGKSKQELKKVLSGYDVVYVEGGNTFYLLKSVRESGFEEVIKELLPNGLVYIGTSAGSYIACPSIIMATWSKKGFDRCGITDFKGMELAPFLMKAHYVPEMKELLEEKSKDLDLPMRVLNDDQAMVIRDEKIQLIGGGDEIIM